MYNISGIQQVGIGVSSIELATNWYAKHFGMNISIFSDEAEASLMAQYTGGKIHKRKAKLLMNFEGGGGFEIWQFTSREPAKQPSIKEGDLGISHVHLRTHNVEKAWAYFSTLDSTRVEEIKTNALGNSFFKLKDPFGNEFKIIQDDYRFFETDALVGGVMGVTIGVSDIENALKLYGNTLKYDQPLVSAKDDEGLVHQWIGQTNPKQSAFSNLLGPTQLELVCDQNHQRSRIFENRFWGDEGFIHVCFDVQNIAELRSEAAKTDFPFVVDSENSFDMGEAAGQFAYIEDSDNTLIELVETHKVPILKKLGLFIHLKDKKIQKPLPRYIFKLMKMTKRI